MALDVLSFSRGRKWAFRALQCIFQLFFLFLKIFFLSKNTSFSLFSQRIKGFVDTKLLINLHRISSLIGPFCKLCKSALLRGGRLIL